MKRISSSDLSSSLPLIVEMKHSEDQQNLSAHDGMASQNKGAEGSGFQLMRIVPPSHIEQGHQLILILLEVGREIQRFTTIHGASGHTEQSHWMECSVEGRGRGLIDCLSLYQDHSALIESLFDFICIKCTCSLLCLPNRAKSCVRRQYHHPPPQHHHY